METVSQQFVTQVTDVKESAEALARAAGKRLEDVRTGTADALHGAASSVRSTGRKSAESIGDFASGAANKLDAAGTYVEKYTLENLPAGLRRTVRRYPASSLIVATAVGFLAASVFRSMTHSCDHE